MEVMKGQMRTITEYKYNDSGELLEVVQNFRLEKPRVLPKPVTGEKISNGGKCRMGLNAETAYPRKMEGAKNVKQGKKSNWQQREQSFGIRIRNLSSNTTNQDVEQLVRSRKCGTFSKIYVAKDNVTGLCRGFAFVEFASQVDACEAIDKLNGFGFENLLLKVDWARRKLHTAEENFCYPSH